MTRAAREGDDVVMFYGAWVLYTLQRVDGDFKLVSDCYLQGLSTGEAAELAFPAEDIRII